LSLLVWNRGPGGICLRDGIRDKLCDCRESEDQQHLIPGFYSFGDGPQTLLAATRECRLLPVFIVAV
jgi:hypothetical protein